MCVDVCLYDETLWLINAGRISTCNIRVPGHAAGLEESVSPFRVSAGLYLSRFDKRTIPDCIKVVATGRDIFPTGASQSRTITRANLVIVPAF